MGSHRRTPLTLADIVPGAVAFFDAEVLRTAAGILRPESAVRRSGPFVCVGVEAESSSWLALTTQPRQDRIHIKPAWIANAYGSFKDGNTFVSCGSDLYRGDSRAFVAAAAEELPFKRCQRPIVLQRGLDAIRAALALPRDARGRAILHHGVST